MNQVVVGASKDSQSACGQSSSAQDVFSEKDMEDAVNSMSDVMATGAHGHKF